MSDRKGDNFREVERVSALHDVVSITKGAKAVHMDRAAFRDFVVRHGLAIRWPGGKRIKVKLSEVEAAILRDRYVPPTTQVKRSSPHAGRLHPLVRC